MPPRTRPRPAAPSPPSARADARLRAAVEGNANAFLLLDAERDATGGVVDFTVVELNARAAALLELPRALALGARLAALGAPAVDARCVAHYARAANGGEPAAAEFAVALPSGVTRWIRHQAVPVAGGVAVTAHDVSGVREQAARAAARARHYRAIARNFPDGAVLLFDRELRVLVAEGAGLPAMSLAAAELEGRSLGEGLPARAYDAVAAGCRAALGGRESSSDVALRGRVYATRIVPVRDEGGAVFAGMLLAQDVTARRLIEDALRESERRFREILETVRLVAVGLDLEGRVTFCNDAMFALTGWTREELVGQNWFELCVPDSAGAREIFSQVAHEGAIVASFENEIITKCGERRLMMWDNTVLRDPSGAVVGTASLGGDVTVRRQEEAAARAQHAAALATADELAREREFLSALLEHIGDGIVACDATGSTTLCNSVLQGFYGLDAPPVTADERRQVHESMYRADGVTRLGSDELPLARAFAGEPVRDAQVVIAPSGRPRRHVLARGQAITHPDGRKLGAVVAFRDVTESRRAAAALAESELRFRTVVESLDEGLVLTDLADVIQHVNPSMLAITGHELDDLLGRVAHEVLLAPEEHEAFRARMAKRQGAKAERYQLRHTRKDGTRVWVEISGVPLANAAGEVVGTLSTVTDITARRAHEEEIVLAKEAAEEARERAEVASRTKSDFLTRMSHELRTPLNSVIGFSDVLRRNQAGNQRPNDVRMLDRVAANGRHLLGLISDILDLSKIEAGALTLELTPVRLDELVAQTVEELEGTASGKAIVLEARVPAGVPPVLTDQTRLKQVLVNLVGNAVKFTERGGVTVTLVADAATGRARRIEVTDTGIGIPAARQAQVFGAFEQADVSTTRKYGGTGLGLAISRALCDALGYTLELESEVGRGSTFRIAMER